MQKSRSDHVTFMQESHSDHVTSTQKSCGDHGTATQQLHGNHMTGLWALWGDHGNVIWWSYFSYVGTRVNSFGQFHINQERKAGVYDTVTVVATQLPLLSKGHLCLRKLAQGQPPKLPQFCCFWGWGPVCCENLLYGSGSGCCTFSA